MEDNKKLLTVLVGATMLIALINVVGTFNLYEKMAAITGGNPSQNSGQQIPTQDNNANQPPSKVDISVANAPFTGSAGAPVTIVEFSDFQCPYCGKFVTETMPQINDTYIKTGKVKLYFRNFPLSSLHENAEKAAEAALCANEQGKFWQYHDKLFANQTALAVTNLKQYAKDLGLNSQNFDSCLDSGKTAEQVKKDTNDGAAYGVQGTPSFFINGTLIVGAQPFSAFQQAIDAALKK